MKLALRSHLGGLIEFCGDFSFRMSLLFHFLSPSQSYRFPPEQR
jgi:hypothetical protein